MSIGFILVEAFNRVLKYEVTHPNIIILFVVSISYIVSNYKPYY